MFDSEMANMNNIDIDSSYTGDNGVNYSDIDINVMQDNDAMGSMNMDDMCCSVNSHCMMVEHYELSPTNMAQTVSYDLHVIQPMLATLPSLVAEWLLSTENKAEVQYYPDVWKSPPRDYLNFIQVLLI